MANNASFGVIRGAPGDNYQGVISIFGEYTTVEADKVLIVHSGVGINLDASPPVNRQIIVKNIANSDVVVSGNGTGIEGNVSATLVSGTSLHFLYDNATPQWWII